MSPIMLLANAFLIFVLALFCVSLYYVHKIYGKDIIALLYVVASVFILLFSMIVVDAVAGLFNSYWQDFFFLDPAFCIVLPFLFLLVNTFFLYKPKNVWWRHLFGIPISLLMLFCTLYFLFIIVVFLIEFERGLAYVPIIVLNVGLMLTAVFCTLTDLQYPARYEELRKKLIRFFKTMPIIVFILSAYVLIIFGHGLIRTRELIFSRVVYERYREKAIGMTVSELSAQSGLGFTKLEEEPQHELWYACAQPQLWYPCRGIRLYVDSDSKVITQVQARGPLVGDTFVYGFDYGRWLSHALVFKFNSLDSYSYD